MNRVRIPLLKHVLSSQLVDGTSELLGPMVNMTMFLVSSRARKRSAGLKAKPWPGCLSVAMRPKHLVVLRPHRRSTNGASGSWLKLSGFSISWGAFFGPAPRAFIHPDRQ
jgi:hypothetical protein